VKVPPNWLEDESVRQGTCVVVRDFLRNTQRDVSVAIYAVLVRELREQKMMLMRHRFNEFDSQRHRFDMSKKLDFISRLQGA
jgi:hypothetical protein